MVRLGRFTPGVTECGLPPGHVTHDAGQQGAGVTQHVTGLNQRRGERLLDSLRTVLSGHVHTLQGLVEFTTKRTHI